MAKFLFWYLGKPVYEGDEMHQHLEYVRKSAGGDVIEAVKIEIKKIDLILNKKKKLTKNEIRIFRTKE